MIAARSLPGGDCLFHPPVFRSENTVFRIWFSGNVSPVSSRQSVRFSRIFRSLDCLNRFPGVAVYGPSGGEVARVRGRLLVTYVACNIPPPFISASGGIGRRTRLRAWRGVSPMEVRVLSCAVRFSFYPAFAGFFYAPAELRRGSLKMPLTVEDSASPALLTSQRVSDEGRKLGKHPQKAVACL